MQKGAGGTASITSPFESSGTFSAAVVLLLPLMAILVPGKWGVFDCSDFKLQLIDVAALIKLTIINKYSN